MTLLLRLHPTQKRHILKQRKILRTRLRPTQKRRILKRHTRLFLVMIYDSTGPLWLLFPEQRLYIRKIYMYTAELCCIVHCKESVHGVACSVTRSSSLIKQSCNLHSKSTCHIERNNAHNAARYNSCIHRTTRSCQRPTARSLASSLALLLRMYLTAACGVLCRALQQHEL